MDDGRAGRSRLQLLGLGLCACGAYYAGSLLGLQLRLPATTPSVLWPPNAILTAILILTAPQRWPVVLFSVLPAHLAVQAGTGWPLPLILLLFLTNCLEAVVGAFLLRRLSDSPTQLNTLRRLCAFFIGVALAAPVVSSFADAAAVALFQGERYWSVWRSRTFSNILAQLTIVPAVVGVAVQMRRWGRPIPVFRAIEAAVVSGSLIVIAVLDAKDLLGSIPALRAVTSQTPLAVQLPFLLWAAVRFGTTGAAVATLTTTIASAWAVVQGSGPFAATAPATTSAALRLSLIVVGGTLLCLGTLIEERRATQQALGDRLEFEALLARMAAAFVQLPGDRMDRAFVEWLARIGEFLRVEAVALCVTPEGDANPYVNHYWIGRPSRRVVSVDVRRDYPWTIERLLTTRPVVFCAPDDLPPEAAADRRSFEALGIRAAAALPLLGSGRVLGGLVVASAVDRAWSEALLSKLRLVAVVVANALARKQNEDALREGESIKSAILHSLASGVAVVDRNGVVLAFNENWQQMSAAAQSVAVETGSCFLEACDAAGAAGDGLALEVRAGVADVLGGRRECFALEYSTDLAGLTRWWSLFVVPLHRPEGGAVLTRANITDQRRAEREAQRSRLELAHVARVSTVGELTASLAHQLKQPLTAIMTNAQVARRLLRNESPDVAEVRAILTDVIEDDQRATDIIQRLRDLMRKGDLEFALLDLASAIRKVAELVGTEAVFRNVTITVDIRPEPIYVRGDWVQLQQAVLNLLYNGIEAMTAVPCEWRVIRLHCTTEGEIVCVRVHDSGPGLPPGLEDQVFEPFFTTKAGGMGMGLSIVRSIVEAHGGTVRASNNALRGAMFELTLPLAKPLEGRGRAVRSA